MPKDDRVYVEHMLKTAQRALDKVAGKSRAEFDADDTLQLAEAHLIQILGEAARLVTPEFRQRHPEIPWKLIVGMRHRIVHDYLQVDYDVVWQVLDSDLSPLVAQLQQILFIDSTP